MKIGILGMGIGRVFAKVCQDLGYEVQVYDLIEEKCRGFIRNPNLEEECQKIIICLPDNLHYRVSKRLLEKRKDVLLVKPATRSVKKLIRLYKLARQKNVVFKVALPQRFRKELPKKDWDGFMAWWQGSEEDVPKWRKKEDVWWDLGIHLVDLFYFTGGKDFKDQVRFLFVSYVPKEECQLYVLWDNHGESVSGFRDGKLGKYNDEYTFRNCVLDWLETKETSVDENYIKAMETISKYKGREKIFYERVLNPEFNRNL